MRVLVYPHSMELGGSQLNAIELAAAVRDRGHDVFIYAEEGVLVDQVRRLGLPFLRSATAGMRPSPAVAKDLRRIAQERNIDVFHGYEWPPILEALAAGGVSRSPATVGTVMSMSVAPFIPAVVPLVVGTERIRSDTARGRSGAVHLIEPPVDTQANRPGVADSENLEAVVPLDGSFTVVIVSRLAQQLKLEGILTAMRAVRMLAARHNVRLVIVGDGPARPAVDAAARAANDGLTRPVVLILGSLADPRSAYDAADVCVGMGGSALRALAFAKPLVVQGEGGFFRTLDTGSLATFLEQGWYGQDHLTESEATQNLVEILESLMEDRQSRERLGAFGRDLVVERFSLVASAERQLEIYRESIVAKPRRLFDASAFMRSGAGLVRYKVERKVARFRGRAATDDFNAKPL